MSAAFARHERVNLVDDDRVHVPQPFTRIRCEQQEQRLRRGDEHIARFAEEPDALACGRIAGSNRDLRDGYRYALASLPRSAMPASGTRRFRSTSTASALRGETYTTRHRLSREGAGSNISRFRHHRNAASVLPVPVGARMSVDSPRAIAGHPSRCGLVGAGNAVENHARTAG